MKACIECESTNLTREDWIATIKGEQRPMWEYRCHNCGHVDAEAEDLEPAKEKAK